MKDIRQFFNLMCIKAGGDFKLGAVYAGVCRKDNVFVYGHTLKGYEMRIIEAITDAYCNNTDNDIIWTPSDKSVAFVECEVLSGAKVVIDLKTIFVTNGE